MKMLMELKSTVSGRIQHIKRNGAVLELGSLIARLELDDDNLVQKNQPYMAKLPKYINPEVKGNKLHQIFRNTKESLSNILSGYHYPNPYFKKQVDENVNTLIKTLRDPSLPLLELQELISTIKSSLPTTVEKQINKLMQQYASNLTSVLAQFPSQKIASIIDSHAQTITKSKEREAFFGIVQGIVQLVQRYRNGIKGHMKTVIQDLIKQYLDIESLFQQGSFDKCVNKLREIHKDNVQQVLDIVFAHSNYENRNYLVILLIDLLLSKDPTLTDELTALLTNLTQLSNNKNDAVSLKARQVLIAFQQPPYEQRHNQMESIFLSAIDMYGHKICQDTMQNLILSETSIFDVLHSFFFHSNIQVRQAALEVYVRRSYIAYELNSVQHFFLSNGSNIVEFQLQLPENHPNRCHKYHTNIHGSISNQSVLNGDINGGSSGGSGGNSSDITGNPHRTGIMAAFDTWEITKECFDEMFDRYNSLLVADSPCNDRKSNDLLDSSETNNIVSSSPAASIMSKMQQYESIGYNMSQMTTPEKNHSTNSLPNGNELSFNKSTSNESLTPNSSRIQTSMSSNEDSEAINILNVFVRDINHNEWKRENDETLAKIFRDFTATKKEILRENNIRRLTFSVALKRQTPLFFTFRARDDYKEDKIYRHLEPALAFQLEIYRLRNFYLELIPTSNLKMHLYLGKAKVASGIQVTDYRFFTRCIIRHSDLITKEASYEFLRNEAERTLLEALNELEVAFSHPLANKTDCNHIYMCFVPCVYIELAKVEESVRTMVLSYGLRLWRLRVHQAELKMTIRLTPDGEKVPIRIFLTNESGYYLDMSMYRERTDPLTGEAIFESFGSKPGPLHGQFIRTPYLTRDHLQQKRFAAQLNGTTYAYDFPEMFKQALMKIWRNYYSQVNKSSGDQSSSSSQQQQQHLSLDNSFENSLQAAFQESHSSQGGKPDPDYLSKKKVFSCTELVIDDKTGELIENNRVHGDNKIGMLAWKISYLAPEYPNGREIILIANDITCKIGSFGMEEDLLFSKASELARKLGIPRIYLSANSGARIGLAEEVKRLFSVAWTDPSNPDKGFRYIYLTPKDYEALKRNNGLIDEESVNVELIEEDGEKRYKIKDIIGKENGLGVENLKGSGMIAGETSQAYNEICTISMVTCRAVGIGAYLVRLGQRVIQVDNSHIILTGAGALNKVLGREVYTSNSQLGGIQIMHNNGITHSVVGGDFEGIFLILNWLSYMPDRIVNKTYLTLPIMRPLFDPVDRLIDYVPTKTAYDPRWMLEGKLTGTQWLTGFFDRGSFHEIMKGWAQTVVCGRARLGGIPLGVISVETRSVELKTPADPANLDSDAKTVQQAGQVWFPDSAYKTAQAIEDFSREHIPLMIFANWRGFSGGMKDMYEQVIKFGAKIVDGLREYKHPVLIYIPPNGELRGGAWVVVDPTINSRYMEMYADVNSRGGVLEPEGTVEIKYRIKDLIKTMHRLDPKCKELIQKIKELNVDDKSEKNLFDVIEDSIR
jgi:acetyl-CoA carboxylase / biotin carboxylase 1